MGITLMIATFEGATVTPDDLAAARIPLIGARR